MRSRIIAALCILLGMASPFLHGTEPVRILLLNSYHKGYLWTDEITRGVEEVFPPGQVDLHVEYLDTKRFFSPEYFNELSSLLELKHRSSSYDVVILSDNNAFNFYRERGRDIFGDIPAVFCGYNNLSPDDLKGMGHITGVNERADIDENLSLIEELHPDISRILLITDDTVTGLQIRSEAERLKQLRQEGHPGLDIVSTVSAPELMELLGNLQSDTVVFMTVFFRDSSGRFFEYDESVRMIADASPVPVFGAWDYQLGLGIVGGYLVSGYQQGRDMAHMALSILDGNDPSDIPLLMDTPVELFFDYRVLDRFGYNLLRLPDKRTIINWPQNFFWKYRFQIAVTASIIILLLMGFFAVLYGFILSRRAEEKVRIREEDLRTTLYSIGDGVITTDLKQRVVRMNPVAEALTGWSNSEALDQPIDRVFRIIDSRTGEPAENPVTISLDEGRGVSLSRHTALMSRKGQKFQISDSASPIKDDLGNITGVVLVFRNITEEYRMQEELLRERNYVKRIIAHSPSLICGLDARGIAVFVNPVIEKITGYREEEIIGKNFWKFFYPGREFEQVKKLLRESDEGVVVNYDMVLTCKKGEKRTIVWNSFSRKDDEGKITGYLGFGYDITGLKLAEKQLYDANIELLRHKDHLEELVADRTMELEISLDHLQQTQNKLVESEKMAALGGLVAGVAHEVNTPVGIGVTAASHLEELVDEFKVKFGKGGVTRRDFELFLDSCGDIARMILYNMKRAGELIQSFKQVAVDQSSQEIRTFLIGEYVEEILLSLHAQLRRTAVSIDISCPEDFEVTSNPGALSQIITNLIMNSLTHGFEENERGTITIDLRKSGDSVLIIYGDTGKGIPEQNLKRIFDPFFTTRRGSGGSGLGMNIVYNLVTRTLGGQISCTSTVGEGTWFELEIPAELKGGAEAPP